jgi:hypothetical protein
VVTRPRLMPLIVLPSTMPRIGIMYCGAHQGCTCRGGAQQQKSKFTVAVDHAGCQHLLCICIRLLALSPGWC